MSTSSEVLNAPDEILILGVEEYLEVVRKMFENTPFVALNLTRTLCIEPAEGSVGGTYGATLVAMGFEAEEIASVPNAMANLTNFGELMISAQDPEIKAMVQQHIYEGHEPPEFGPLPVLEAITHKVDQQALGHPELAEVMVPDHSTLMQF